MNFVKQQPFALNSVFIVFSPSDKAAVCPFSWHSKKDIL